jgi:hypothetical protein
VHIGCAKQASKRIAIGVGSRLQTALAAVRVGQRLDGPVDLGCAIAAFGVREMHCLPERIDQLGGKTTAVVQKLNCSAAWIDECGA